jgi:TIR domain-containing protein
MDHNAWSSVWKTDCFLAVCCRITGASGLEYIFARKCPLPLPSDASRVESAMSTNASKQAIEVFFSYAHPDEALRDELAKHLRLLEHQGIIAGWHDRHIIGGTEWGGTIDSHLETAKLVLFLVSADFLASDYCYDIEMQRAMARHAAGEARVIPVILRAVDWHSAPFGNLQALPRNARPVTHWQNRDEAFYDIAIGIRLICEELIASSSSILSQSASFGLTTAYHIWPLYKVFKSSGVPDVTFVERRNFSHFKLSMEQPGRGVIIEGPSGIGKTTALKKADPNIEILSARNPEHVERLSNLRKWHNKAIAIDDFHRLPKSLSEQLIDYLKYLADYEIPGKKIIIAGIPQTGKRLIDVSFDIATRIDIFKLSRVENHIILEMIEKGEDALNVKFSRKSEIVQAASGSLNIAQMLCFHLCALQDINSTQKSTVMIDIDIEIAISKVMEHVLSPKFGEFVQYFASLGGRRDFTCIELLKELSLVEDGFLSFAQIEAKRSDLTIGLDHFVQDRYMDSLYNKIPNSSNYLFFDESIPALIIDDPQLSFYLLQTPTSRLLRNTGKSKAPARNKVFVSYSHADSEWLERLRTHLKPLERESVLDLWVDTRIQSGARWRDEIRKAIEMTKVAILFVSARFLASDFIMENELPPLLAAAEKEGAIVLPVIISPSRFLEYEFLSNIQSINSSEKPLTAMNYNEQEEIFVRISKLDFIHLGNEALPINILGSHSILGFLNVR